MTKNKKTVAIILCGGEGKRLGNIGRKINKTLIKYKKKKTHFSLFQNTKSVERLQRTLQTSQKKVQIFQPKKSSVEKPKRLTN